MEQAVEQMAERQPTKLAKMIRLWLAANDIDQKALEGPWQATGATISRFLNGAHMPDGRTTARIIAWILEP